MPDMNVIDSTPEFVASVYQKMAQRLEIVRSRLNRPLSLADKLLLGHLDDPETTELERGKTYVQLRADRGHPPGCPWPDGDAPVRADWAVQGGGAHHSALRPI